MMQIEEALRLNASRLDEIESNLAFYSSELSDDRNKMNTMDEALQVLRNDSSSSRVSVNGTRGDKQIVTSIRGFDKLKMYKGAAVEWKEWRFKLITWLSQSTPSYETLLVKLDYCESEPIEPADGVTMKAGTSELTTEEEWCSEQLYQLLVQKCEGPALDIIRYQNTKGKARGLIAWYRTLREAEGQVPTKVGNHRGGVPPRQKGGSRQGCCLHPRSLRGRYPRIPKPHGQHDGQHNDGDYPQYDDAGSYPRETGHP